CALLELLQDPGISAYKFQADVRHLDAKKHEQVGIYLSRSQFPVSKGTVNVFMELSYREFADRPGEEARHIALDATLLRELAVPSTLQLVPGNPGYFPITQKFEKLWRTLIVTVTSEEIVATWTGSDYSDRWTWVELNQIARKNLKVQN